MLRWTPAGAVSTPTWVQIRVQRSYPGRIRAGAPTPTRSMSADELVRNIRYFTEELRGTRSTPCIGLVLSGVGVTTRSDVPNAIDLSRSLGIGTVVLHAGGEDILAIDPLRFTGRADRIVVPVQPESGQLTALARTMRNVKAAGIKVSANTVLTSNALPLLHPMARALAKAKPESLTFTYPFPITGNESTSAPSPPRVMTALRTVLPDLDRAGIRIQIKGLPACHLGSEGHRLAKTQNRYYVDADHQGQDALMFFPDVVRFHKSDGCRHCEVDKACDGFFATYLRRPGFPRLKPIDSPTESDSSA